MSTSTDMASQSQSAKKTAEAASSSSEPVSTAEQTASFASSATGLITNTNATNSTNLNLNENFNSSDNPPLVGGLPTATVGESKNTMAPANTDNYTVSLMSGDEFLLSRKEVLLEVIIERLREIRERDSAAHKDEETCEANMAIWAGDVEIYTRRLEEAEREQREAAAHVLATKADLDGAKREEQKLAAELKDLKQTAAEIGAKVASVEELLESVQNLASADDVRELIGRHDERSASSDEKPQEADTSGKSETSEEIGGKNQARNVNKSLAGKRQREEDNLAVGNANSDLNEKEHRRKEVKWDESEFRGGSNTPGVAEIDADLGLVFNSPGRDTNGMEMVLGSGNHDSCSGADEFTLSASIVRLHAYRAISEQRSSQGLRTIPDVNLIFCLHKVTGEVFSNLEGDTALVPESVLMGGDLMVGVRNIPEFDFSVIMRPFQILSGMLCDDKYDVVLPDSGVDGERENGNGSDVVLKDNATDVNERARWWEIKGRNGDLLPYSEHEAIKQIAALFCGFRGDGTGESPALVAPFFRHYWSQWHETGGSQKEDLKFALSEIHPCETIFPYRNAGIQTCMFPTALAIKIAEFQLDDSTKVDGQALLCLFPRYSAQLVAGLRSESLLDVDRNGTIALLRFLTNLSGAVPALLSSSGPWSWPPRDREETVHDTGPNSIQFDMPLLRVFRRQWQKVPTKHLQPVILDLLTHAQIEARQRPSSDTKLSLHWNLKQCVVRRGCQNAGEWEEYLRLREGSNRATMIQCVGTRLHGALKAELALMDAMRKIEGAFVRPEKKVRLGRETVVQLDI